MLSNIQRLLIAGCASLAVVLSGAALAATPAKVADGVLVNDAGMTLYTFDKDVADSGKSVCNGKCAALWPPVMAEAGAAPGDGYSTVKRDDGSAQLAYKGKPLYSWVKDQKPGDRTGDGVNGVWHLATP